MRHPRPRTPRVVRGRAVEVWSVCLLLLVAAGSALAMPPLTAGTPLISALEELRDQGVELIWSSSLVSSEMRLGRQPLDGSPREVLGEILAPHGLVARLGESGTLVVVEGAYEGPAVRGVVRSRWAALPLGGVEVVVTGRDASTERPTVRSDGAGGFELSGLPEGSYTLEARRPGFVVEALAGVEVRAGRSVEVSFALQHTPLSHEEIVVVPSRLSLLDENPAAPLSLSRQDVTSLPHLGDDALRALTLLPGVTGNDLSAQFQVRGGRRDEVQILLDGQELYEAFHLKDFDNALSIVGAGALASVDLSTGGFQVPFGDRMGGVLDMTTVTPREKVRSHLGLSLLTAQAGTAGTVDGGGGHWLGLLRTGSTELAERLVQDDQPSYWDAYAKLGRQLTGRQSLRFNALGSGDRYRFEEVADEQELNLIDTRYDSAYLWVTHQGQLGRRLLVESAISWSDVRRDRRGIEKEDEQRVEVQDRRQHEVRELRQRWDGWSGGRHSLTWGFGLREFDVDFDYLGDFEFDSPIAYLRELREGVIDFRSRRTEHHGSVFVVDRFRPSENLSLELGLRFDHHSLGDEGLTSPRLNLAYTLGKDTVLRAAWGLFVQSQRPYELQVEDGEARFFPAERSEQRLLGVERHFRRPSGRSLAARLELYQREIENPRQRFENLFEPLNVFPEFEPDRVRLSPGDSSAEGVELFLRGEAPREVAWWLSYAYATTEDETAEIETRRPVDQPHTLNLSLALPLRSWRLHLAWRYHTGWPTTALSLEEMVDDEGEVELRPVLGPIHGERLPDYHRLDLRLSRQLELRRGTLSVFLEVQNLYDHQNLVGVDYTVDEDLEQLVVEPEAFEGVLPSAGLRWEF